MEVKVQFSRAMVRRATATAVVGTMMCVGLAAPAYGKDTQQVKRTQDGYTLRVMQKNTRVDGVPPLDSSPFSREAFLSSDNSALIEGPAGAVVRGAVMESGYHIGFPASVGQDGVDVTLKTPDLSVNGGLNAGVNGSVTPSVSGNANVSPSGPSGGGTVSLTGTAGGNAGGNVGAQSTIIPSQSFSFRVEHGKITEVPLARVAMSSPKAYANFGGVHLFANGAAGQLTVRTYTKLTVQTPEGVSTVVAYGEAVRL